MLFVIDVGNTNIVLGFYKGTELIASYRMATDKNKSSDEIGLFFSHILANAGIKPEDVKDVIISSVVPPIMHALVNASRKYLDKYPIIIQPAGMPLGLNILTDNPGELGADRLVNAYAAHKIYKSAAIIIDFGTATTFCAVTSGGNYLGGVIYPGLKISMDALVEKTSKLPRVEILRPMTVIGKNTVHSMQSGIVYGYAGMVDAIVRRMKSELAESDIRVVATGGLSKLIADVSEEITDINANLTLEGLRLIYEQQ
ncbi:MAG: type III pantothenate kinase [Clostridia bacterium]|nr:type III pantothenate kinase [Clostridia bacterium]